jgi:hypothetical protein
MNDLRDTCHPDGAADRAASAARTLAAIAHDAARKYVERDVVTSQADRLHPNMVAWNESVRQSNIVRMGAMVLDDAERERQNRLRRWQALPYPNRKGG